MPPYMKNSAVFVDATDALVDLSPQDGKLALQRQRLLDHAMQQRLPHVVKNPWVA